MSLKEDFREKTIGYILTAFGLVAGLAWNDAIKDLINQFLPPTSGGLVVKFLYALLLTLIIVVVSFYLVKLIKNKDENV